jgi:hypothetical protein
VIGKHDLNDRWTWSQGGRPSGSVLQAEDVVRLRALYWVALGSATLVVAAAARADETFLCEDGSSVTIDSTNRIAMQEHPCVKAWFRNDRALRKASVGVAKEGLVVHRHTAQRATALRDLQQRPAYLAWLRSRTVEAQPAPGWKGARRSYVRSLLNDKPAAQTKTKSARSTSVSASARAGLPHTTGRVEPIASGVPR